MYRWLASLSVVFVLGAVAHAAPLEDLSTCLRADGVRFGPWTDPFEPACGADCGDPVTAVTVLCSTEADDCDTAREHPIEMPQPTGPRCLEPAPGCGPHAPQADWVMGQGVANAPPHDTYHPPNQGTLPGAGPPTTRSAPYTHHCVPETPPPRTRG